MWLGCERRLGFVVRQLIDSSKNIHSIANVPKNVVVFSFSFSFMASTSTVPGTHVNFHLFPVSISMFSPFHVPSFLLRKHLFPACISTFPHFQICSLSCFHLFPFPSVPFKHFTITLGIPITIIYHPNSCPKNQAVLPTGSHRYFH